MPDSTREKGPKSSLSTEHFSMAIVEVASRSTARDDMDRNWNESARAGTATYTTLHRRVTGGNKTGMATAGLAEAFHRTRVEDMVKRPSKYAEPQKSEEW